MRITNNMLISNVMNNMYNNLERMNKVNKQYSSGRKFSMPDECAPLPLSKTTLRVCNIGFKLVHTPDAI